MITLLPSKTYKSDSSAKMPPLAAAQLQKLVPSSEAPGYRSLRHMNDDLIDQNNRLFSVAVYGSSVGFIMGLILGAVLCSVSTFR